MSKKTQINHFGIQNGGFESIVNANNSSKTGITVFKAFQSFLGKFNCPKMCIKVILNTIKESLRATKIFRVMLRSTFPPFYVNLDQSLNFHKMLIFPCFKSALIFFVFFFNKSIPKCFFSPHITRILHRAKYIIQKSHYVRVDAKKSSDSM